MRLLILPGASLVAAICLIGQGCGPEEEDKGPSCATNTCPFDYSTFDGTEPVSFETDVFPILRRSCGIATVCHGDAPGLGAANLYLGPKKSDDTIVIDAAFRQSIIDGLVGVTSQTVPGPSADAGDAGDAGDAAAAGDAGDAGDAAAAGEAGAGGAKLIVAGDPSQSFFMLKMDGCQNQAGLSCVKIKSNKTELACGESMPDGNLLCDEERDLFRRWIAQGAQNN